MLIKMVLIYKFGIRNVILAYISADSRKDLPQHLFHISSANKYFDKFLKSYIYDLKGQSASLKLPANPSQNQLALQQKYLVFNLYIPISNTWTLELGITDQSGFRRRINLTTADGKEEMKYFSLRYPIRTIEKGCWLFLAINIYSFMEGFKETVFKSLDHIIVGSSCKIRRIFTMKEWDPSKIPNDFFFTQLPQQTQLIEYKSGFLPKIQFKNASLTRNTSINSLHSSLKQSKHESRIIQAKLPPNEDVFAIKSKLFLQQKKAASRFGSLSPLSPKERKKKKYQSNKGEQMSNLPSVGRQKSAIGKKEKIKLKKKAILNKCFQEDEMLGPSQEEMEEKPAEMDGQIELIYDEMVGCLYHPQTKTYFELKK